MTTTHTQIIITGRDRASGVMRQTARRMNLELERVKRQTYSLQGAFAALGVGLSAAAVTRYARSAVQDFAELERVGMRVQKQLELTGVDWTSWEEINDLARRVGRETMASASDVRQAASLMLVSGNATQENFERSIRLAQDLAEVMEMNLPTAARYLSRATTDVSGALSRLRQRGIDLNDTQREVIETLVESGRETEAFDYLLSQLEARIGGAAEAAGSRLAGAFSTLNVSTEQLREEIGEALAPVVQEITENTSEWVDANRELLAQEVAQWVERTYNSAQRLVNLYRGIPDDVVGAVGVGIVGRLVGGGKFGVLAGSLYYINQQLDRMGGTSVQNLTQSYRNLGEAVGNLWDVMAGRRHWHTGELLGEGLPIDEPWLIEPPDRPAFRPRPVPEPAPAPEPPPEPEPVTWMHDLFDWDEPMQRFVQNTLWMEQEFKSHLDRLKQEEARAADERARIQDRFADDHARATMGMYEYERYQLQQQYEYYRQFVDDIVQLYEWKEAVNEDIARREARAIQRALDQALSFQEDFVDDSGETMSELLEHIERGMWDMTTVAVRGLRSLEDTLVDVATTGRLEFRDMVDSFIRDLLRLQIQQNIIRPLAGFMGGWGIFNARGNAYVDGRVQGFASGGIVDRPTMFRHSGGLGVMGEAGTEAILPLTRTRGGDLGVKAQSQATSIEINMNFKSPAQGDLTRRLEQNIRREVERTIRESM